MALLVVVGIAALGWVVMALWNWLIPSLFIGAKEIGYVQAMGLLLLSKILFGGFRGHGCARALAPPSPGKHDAGRTREIPGGYARLLRRQEQK